jgi:hypothetical protein
MKIPDPRGKTVFRQAVEKTVCASIEQDKNWLAFLAEIQHKESMGFWEQWYVDMFCQKHFDNFDVYDAWSFIQLHSALWNGSIGWASVFLGETPGKDQDREGNNAKLKKLASPFGAVFEPSIGAVMNDDGAFWWNAPINFAKHNRETNQWKKISLEPKCIPIEVGYTNAEISYFHVFTTTNALARWPYYSQWIHIFVSLEKNTRSDGDVL